MSHPELEALVLTPRKRDLSVRAYNALANAGLTTLQQVRAADLTCVRNMGPKLRRFVEKRVAARVAHEDADFVKVERWECRIGCGALLRAEDIAGHGCKSPDGQGTEADPACANCGELRSAHAPSDFPALPPYCRSTPFHLVHFRSTLIHQRSNVTTPTPQERP